MLLTKKQFLNYASKGYNRIPLIREVVADLDTPVSTYLKLANGKYSYLLESVQGGEKWGQYSIIGMPCRTLIRARGNRVEVLENEKIIEQFDNVNPLDIIEQFQKRYHIPQINAMPRFNGGLVGYFGYETIRYIEPLLTDPKKPDSIGGDDILLMVSEELAVFDNLSGKILLIIYADPTSQDAYEKGLHRLETLNQQLSQPVYYKKPSKTEKKSLEPVNYHFPKSDYTKAIEKIRNYIYEGDIFQTVLSQRISLEFNAPAFDLYRSLRMLNPSPYMYYLNLDELHVVGSSPEILVRLEDGEVTLRPIAGTRPRGKNKKHDDELEKGLLADTKELAEHLMLVDLGRNDVGRIAKPGSVKVTDMMSIERYSHVMHIVSNVVGKTKGEFTAIDVLKATFPAGTVSGAPKVRAMQIIDELEPEKRGIYSGAIGYIGWNGNMDTAIAIRTAVIKNQTLYIQAGGGVVADSTAENEWQETINKAKALVSAAENVVKSQAGVN